MILSLSVPMKIPAVINMYPLKTIFRQPHRPQKYVHNKCIYSHAHSQCSVVQFTITEAGQLSLMNNLIPSHPFSEILQKCLVDYSMRLDATCHLNMAMNRPTSLFLTLNYSNVLIHVFCSFGLPNNFKGHQHP